MGRFDFDYYNRSFTLPTRNYHTHRNFPPFHRGPAAMKQWIGERIRPTEEQRRILWILGLQAILIVVMYQWSITKTLLYPFQIISTVFHEFGHALMCVLTGGRVRSIIINADESGLTRFQGGWPCLVSPAGYIGSTVAGSILLFTGFDVRRARYASMGVAAILALTLYWSGSLFTVISSVSLMAMMGGVAFYQEGRILRYFILFMGAIGCLSSLLSIANSTIFHVIEGSDAVQFARHCSVLIPSVVYGFLWLVVSIGAIAASICGALICFK